MFMVIAAAGIPAKGVAGDVPTGVGVEILGLIGFAHEFLSPCKVYSRNGSRKLHSFLHKPCLLMQGLMQDLYPITSLDFYNGKPTDRDRPSRADECGDGMAEGK